MHVSRRVVRQSLRSIQGRQDWRGMQHAYGTGGIQNGSRKTEQKKDYCVRPR
jgi:hypothetical protein